VISRHYPLAPVTAKETENEVVVGIHAALDARGDFRDTLITIKPYAGIMREIGNIAVVGAPGAGKTRLIEVNLNSWAHSVVVIDLKGDLYHRTAEHRKTLGSVYVIDPRRGAGNRYNPLAVIKLHQRRELATELVSATTDDPFWLAATVDMWLAGWAAADHAGKPHMPYAVELMSLGVADAMRYFLEHHGEDPVTMKHVTDFYGRRPTQAGATRLADGEPSRLLESKWATVTTTRAVFDDKKLLSVFSGHDLDIEGMFYSGSISSIYIMADETNPRVFMAFSRLVLKTLGDALINEGDRINVKRRPVLFLFDEFGSVRLNSVHQWLNTMRSRDVVLVLFVQKLSQLAPLNKEYDEDDENSIHHWILLKPTNPAGRISKMITAMSGQEVYSVAGGQSTSTNGDTVTQGQNTVYKERAVVRQDNIERWQMNEAYAVLTQRQTEKYRLTIASLDLLGWASPPPAPPPARLPPYVSPLLDVPSRSLPPPAPERRLDQARTIDAVDAMLAALNGKPGLPHPSVSQQESD
jgi:type IV secretory pathway TraG/TraD family ATPase VirD4